MFVHNPAKGAFNPDSVLIDTCGGGKVRYARKSFEVRFVQTPLHSKAEPTEAGYYNLEDFDTTLVDYDDWEQLATTFAPFVVKWIFDSTFDSVGLAYRTYWLDFGDYVPVDSIVDMLREFSNVEYAQYIHRAMKRLSPTDVLESSPSERLGYSLQRNDDGYIDVEWHNMINPPSTFHVYDVLGRRIAAEVSMRELSATITMQQSNQIVFIVSVSADGLLGIGYLP